MHSRKVLQEMLQAALCTKTEYNNIRAIASEASGFGGQAFTAQVNASQAEKTITRYSNDNGFNKSGRSGSTMKGPLRCYSCGGPHPWFLLKNGIHVIKCPKLATQASVRTPRKSLSAFNTSAKRNSKSSQSPRTSQLHTSPTLMPQVRSAFGIKSSVSQQTPQALLHLSPE